MKIKGLAATTLLALASLNSSQAANTGADILLQSVSGKSAQDLSHGDKFESAVLKLSDPFLMQFFAATRLKNLNAKRFVLCTPALGIKN